MKTYVIELVRIFEITSDKDLNWHQVIINDEKLYHTTNKGLDNVMLVSADVSVIDIVNEEKEDN